MKYLLFVIALWGNGPAMSSRMLDDLASCEAAIAQLSDPERVGGVPDNKYSWSIYAECIAVHPVTMPDGWVVE